MIHQNSITDKKILSSDFIYKNIFKLNENIFLNPFYEDPCQPPTESSDMSEDDIEEQDDPSRNENFSEEYIKFLQVNPSSQIPTYTCVETQTEEMDIDSQAGGQSDFTQIEKESSQVLGRKEGEQRARDNQKIERA